MDVIKGHFRFLLILVVLIFSLWFGSTYYYREHCPVVADQETGRIYEARYAGNTVYLNFGEAALRYLLPVIGAAIFIYLIIRVPKEEA